MKKTTTSNEQLYYDALRRITQYKTVAQLSRTSEKEYGLEFAEALEYAYENVIGEAKNALRGKRRPNGVAPTPATVGAPVEAADTRYPLMKQLFPDWCSTCSKPRMNCDCEQPT